MNDKVAQIQAILGVAADGIWGPQSEAALELLVHPIETAEHKVKASSFADPADVAAFRHCKANGGSDMECFAKGDNGIGFTGMDCSRDDVCLCALPPEVWRPKWGNASNAAGKPVIVSYKGVSVRGAMGDTMPHLSNIKNGAGIDLNPGFGKSLGIKPPFMLDGVTWRWA